jgi:hypothetical protein
LEVVKKIAPGDYCADFYVCSGNPRKTSFTPSAPLRPEALPRPRRSDPRLLRADLMTKLIAGFPQPTQFSIEHTANRFFTGESEQFKAIEDML